MILLSLNKLNQGFLKLNILMLRR